jgi:hypothetical protein
METATRWFLALASLAVVAMVLRNPSGTSTVISGLAQGSNTVFGTFVNAVPQGGA